MSYISEPTPTAELTSSPPTTISLTGHDDVLDLATLEPLAKGVIEALDAERCKKAGPCVPPLMLPLPMLPPLYKAVPLWHMKTGLRKTWSHLEAFHRLARGALHIHTARVVMESTEEKRYHIADFPHLVKQHIKAFLRLEHGALHVHDERVAAEAMEKKSLRIKAFRRFVQRALHVNDKRVAAEEAGMSKEIRRQRAVDAKVGVSTRDTRRSTTQGRPKVQCPQAVPCANENEEENAVNGAVSRPLSFTGLPVFVGKGTDKNARHSFFIAAPQPLPP